MADNTTNGTWVLGLPANTIINSASSGANAWATNLTGAYNASESSWVTSPVFDFSSLIAPGIQLKVWWNSEFSWDGMVLQSSINGGTSWQNVGALGDPGNWYTDNTIAGNPGGQQEGWSGRNSSANGSGAWVTANHPLGGLGGQSNVLLRLAFGSDGSVQDEGVAFDDINVFDVLCPQPSALTATNILATSADLGWTENGTATTWDVEWGTAGFAPTGTPTITGTTTNPHNLTGLTATTAYDFYVRADCGGGNGLSVWTGPFTFNTSCASINAPWLDDVEAHTPTTALGLSNCWSATAATGYDWNIDGLGSTPSSNTGPTGAFSGVNYFYTEASGAATGAIAELYSPNIDLTALTIPVLEFYYHMTGAQMGDLFVDIWDGSTWSTVDSIMGQQQAAQADPWLKRFVNLSTFSGTVQIRFRAISNGSFEGDISLDDIEVKEAPSCPDPTALTATNIVGASADLTWIENSTATTWEIEWGATGFAQGAGTTVLTTTNPHNLTGLTPVTTYDFYVRSVCGPADSSMWVGPMSFTTTVSCPAPTAQTVTSITIVAADLGWTENGLATTWEIEWGATGFVQGAGTSVITTTNPHNLTGLSNNTAYDFYVRAVCGAADSSLWTGASSFTTLCNPTVAPFMDSVEVHTPTTNLTNSNCWNATATGTYGWDISGTGTTPSTATGPLAAFSGTNFFFTEASSGTAGDVAELLSPSIDLSALTIPSVEFYYHMFGNSSGEMGDLFIDVWDGSTWTTVDSIIGQQQTAQADPWLLKVVDISTYTGVIQVRFRAIGNGTFHGDISLDNIEVKESSVITCVIPTTLTATNATNNTVDLAWMENGTATTWEIEWDITGFVQGTGSAVVTTTNPHILTGLTINTTYDFYVRAICSAGDSSAWSNAGNFSTLNVGINDLSTNVSIDVYPNPSNGVFTLNVNTTDVSELDIKVMNIQGQVVFAKNNFDNVSTINEQIDLSDNANGIYFITVTSDKGIVASKIIVQ